MSLSASIRSHPTAVAFAAYVNLAPGRVLFVLGRLITHVRRRQAERQIALAVAGLQHPGVIDDFRQASRR